MEKNKSENNTTTNDKNIDFEYNFKWGEMIKMVRVRFPGNAKSFGFLLKDHYFKYGESVIAMSDRGLQVGYINSFPYEVPYTEKLQPLKTINRTATQQDVTEQINLFKKKKKRKKFAAG